MTFYHGTNSLIHLVDLSKCRNRTDFGKGFYLTDKFGTAQEWALRKTEIRGGISTVLSFTINDGIFKLEGKRFNAQPTLEWLEFISLNRQTQQRFQNNKEPRHNYHWVSGSIADDRIADVVDEYLEGDISADEAISRAKVLPQSYQLSLHTREAVCFLDELNVLYRQFKNGGWSKQWIARKN